MIGGKKRSRSSWSFFFPGFLGSLRLRRGGLGRAMEDFTDLKDLARCVHLAFLTLCDERAVIVPQSVTSDRVAGAGKVGRPRQWTRRQARQR